MSALVWDAVLSLPASALLSIALQRRYRCSFATHAAFFVLGVYLTLLFCASWAMPSNPTPITHIRLLDFTQSPDAPQIVLNLLLFLPFSLLTSLLFPHHRRLLTQLILVLSLSLLLEIGQILLQQKTSLYDPLLHLSGGCFGCGIAHTLHRNLPKKCAVLEVRTSQCLLLTYVLSALALYCILTVFRLNG